MTDPIDPAGGTAFALRGRVVTMNDHHDVLDDGVVYVQAGSIVSARDAAAGPPSGHGDTEVIPVDGTIYPGLIDLHNHLPYDVLRLWAVPQRYENRDTWQGQPAYRQIISGPMNVLGRTAALVPAIVRYVEAKALLGGTTTTQGIALFSNAGITRFYRGIVRNAEQTGEADLPQALTRIPDIDAEEAGKFLDRQRSTTCLLLHLSEGTNDRAHDHFEALHLKDDPKDDEWAITPSLAGIHCVALTAADYDVMAANGASMVWSPLSNLLLYGQTARIAEAKASGIRIGLGCDWAPSGSKNLLGELKVARLAGAGAFTDRHLVELVTTNAARILGWDGALGSLERGKRADLLVIGRASGDAYATLVDATEPDVALVVINGVPRYGTTALMGRFGPGTETLRIGRAERTLNLAQETQDPAVAAMTLAQATDALTDGLHRLKDLAKALEDAPAGALAASPVFALPSPEGAAAAVEDQGPMYLYLDHDEPSGMALRPHLPGPDGAPTGMLAAEGLAAAANLSDILGPLDLDLLTAAEDPGFVEGLREEKNLPGDVKDALGTLGG